jgi:hypothetical protein
VVSFFQFTIFSSSSSKILFSAQTLFLPVFIRLSPDCPSLPSLTYRHPLAPNIPQPIRVITCQKQQWNTSKCTRSDEYLRLIPGTCEVPLEIFRLTSNIHKVFH